jgi:hypothetical protein
MSQPKSIAVRLPAEATPDRKCAVAQGRAIVTVTEVSSPFDADVFRAARQKHDQVEKGPWQYSETTELVGVTIVTAAAITSWFAYAVVQPKAPSAKPRPKSRANLVAASGRCA